MKRIHVFGNTLHELCHLFCVCGTFSNILMFTLMWVNVFLTTYSRSGWFRRPSLYTRLRFANLSRQWKIIPWYKGLSMATRNIVWSILTAVKSPLHIVYLCILKLTCRVRNRYLAWNATRKVSFLLSHHSLQSGTVTMDVAALLPQTVTLQVSGCTNSG